VGALAANGEHPHQREAQLLLAQLWLETGRGSACNNFNVGNISASSKYEGGAFRPAWYTISEGSSAQMKRLHEQMLKGQAPSAFRAYATLEAGMGDYVHQLNTTFQSIVAAARSGDALATANAIKTSRYTPDIDPPAVAKSLDSIAKEFAARGTFAALPLAGASQPPPAAPAAPLCPPA
jgi:flagellum-specific peptidoglycan hydrolase FlgJ